MREGNPRSAVPLSRRASNVEFLDQQVCQAWNGAQRAASDLGRALARVANPREMYRFHPIGTVSAIGTLGVAGAAAVASPSARRWLRHTIANSINTARSAVVAALMTQVFWGFVGAGLRDPGFPDCDYSESDEDAST
jgi:hypothetical protein